MTCERPVSFEPTPARFVCLHPPPYPPAPPPLQGPRCIPHLPPRPLPSPSTSTSTHSLTHLPTPTFTQKFGGHPTEIMLPSLPAAHAVDVHSPGLHIFLTADLQQLPVVCFFAQQAESCAWLVLPRQVYICNQVRASSTSCHWARLCQPNALAHAEVAGSHVNIPATLVS